jgi:hypothetical protein
MHILTYAVTFVLLLSSLACSHQQSSEETRVDSLLSKRVSFSFQEFPVVFEDSAATFPDTIEIRGIVEGITSIPVQCGVNCSWGTAKVRLQEKLRGYSPDTVFVAVQCLYGKEADFAGKRIQVTLTKFLRDELNNSCGSIANRFDSHGQPFYKPVTENGFRLGLL